METSTRSHEDMLRHLFNKAKELTTTPMRDITGQGAYVDRYLSNKTARMQLAHQLATIEKEIIAAEGNSNAWKQLLGSS